MKLFVIQGRSVHLKTLFIIVVLINFLKAFLPSGLLNVFFILSIFILYLYNIQPTKMLKWKVPNFICFINISIVSLHFLYSIFIADSNLKSASTFCIQFSFFWFSFYTLLSILNNAKQLSELPSMIKFVSIIGSIIASISLFERFVPEHILVYIVNKITISKGIIANEMSHLPLSYVAIELGTRLRRPGSIFFEPVTFGLFIGIILLHLFSYKSSQLVTKHGTIFKVISVSAVLFSFVKSSYVLLIGVFFKNKKIIIVSLLFLIFVPFLFMYAIAKVNTQSIMVHVSGLVNGINAGISKPLLGYGQGKAGFLSLVILEGQGIANQYFETSDPTKNGNESLIGIIAYQFGITYLLIYIFSFVALSWHLRQKGCNVIFVLPILKLIIDSLTESTISIVVQYTMALVISLNYIHQTKIRKKTIFTNGYIEEYS